MIGTPAPLRRCSVLHVDDFDEFLEEFRALFSEDFDLTSAQSGAEGLALLEGRDFDAVILDYEMPDMDGLAFIAAAKQKWPLLPVIFCTGQGSEEVARRAFTAGASDYFVKDFGLFASRERLVHSVRQAMERRAVEEALRKERLLLQKMIEFNPYAIQIYNQDGHPVRENPASRRLWNRPEDVPFADYAYKPFDDPALLAAGFGPLFDRVRQGEVMPFPVSPYETRDQDGKGQGLRYVSAVGFGLLDERGQFDTMVIMQEDITARVTAEEALKASRDTLERRVEERTAELAEANRTLEQQAEKRERLQKELIRKNRELEAFSSRVSHDLRNELLVLKRTLELASEEHPDIQKRLQGLLERYDHLIQFVERLLSLSRTGNTISSRVEMPAMPLLRGLFERLHPPDVAAELNIPADAAPIPGDPLTLEQVFANLISNSFQYRNAKQDRLRVDVEARLEGGETEVVYRDNGMGIDPDHLDRIFDMSFTTDRTGHFGLGLSFAKKIVEAHGGTIRAASAGRGHGATFIMRLPLPLAKRKALANPAAR